MAITILDEKVRHEGTPILADSFRVLAYLETKGQDEFSLDIPSGYEIEKVEVILSSDVYKTGVTTEEQPPPKATGECKVKLNWRIASVSDPLFQSFIEYRIRATTIPSNIS